MLGLAVLAFGLMPFVLGVVAWRLLSRGGGSPSDDGPPPPPSDPRPVTPSRPRRRADRGPAPSVRTRVPQRRVRS